MARSVTDFILLIIARLRQYINELGLIFKYYIFFT
jgi:hypothetical protein